MDYADRDEFNRLADKRAQLLAMRAYIMINDSDNGIAISARDPAKGAGKYTVGEPVISAKVTSSAVQSFLTTLIANQLSNNEANFLALGCTVTDQEGVT